MDTLASRLKLARQRANMTQSALAEASNMRQAEISKLEAGAVGRSSRVVEIARALRCDPYWLSTGKGEPWGQPADADLEIDHRGGNVVGIEVRGASEFYEGDIDVRYDDPSTRGVILGSGVHNGYAIKVKGDRNAPTLKDGQFVVVEARPVRPGELGLFHFTDGNVVLRELLRETDDAYYVDSALWGARQTLDKATVTATEAIVAVVSPSQWAEIFK